jgi:hypothetical protein
MKARLIVKNFGPIEDVSLDLRNVNVFIGPQASGKSTLAKIFTICNSPRKFCELNNDSFFDEYVNLDSVFYFNIKVSIEKFYDSLKDYSLEDFIKRDTHIHFESDLYDLIILNGKISFKDKYPTNHLFSLFNKNIGEFNIEKNRLKKLYDQYINKVTLGTYKSLEVFSNEKNSKFKSKNIKSDLEDFVDDLNRAKTYLFDKGSIYIPAERTIVSLIKQSSFAFQKGRVPLPEYLLDFAIKFQNATSQIKNFDLNFIKKDVFYKNIDGEDRIFYSKNDSIKLTQSASGFQSLIPLLLTLQFEIDYNALLHLQHSFIIEECESNLFPEAQYGLLKVIESYRSSKPENYDSEKYLPFKLREMPLEIVNIFTTHSPFVLSSFNNMLYAYKKGSQANDEIKSKINNIISAESWLNPEEFSAYQIVNGKAKSIMDRKIGLIKDNIIDRVSDEIVNDFRKIGIASLSNE